MMALKSPVCIFLMHGHFAADRITAVLTAANVTVEPFYPTLFAKFLETNSLDSMFSNVAAGGGGGGGGAAPAAAAEEAPAKKEEKKVEEEEEDDEMGFGLFD
eukprot:NODE_3033_length_607_cov_342.668459_g2535_i0.p1 GENE.NODE_3033_length_607_cov_342.668459_g2535_i0~~NODE_3033_length_607_cov_342.668459_g2535_i0.p1  ORF type:complete len:102 (+),score=34.17 NODE_3033_length_607_cov_342.668459_g2535_i0:138-443(+)